MAWIRSDFQNFWSNSSNNNHIQINCLVKSRQQCNRRFYNGQVKEIRHLYQHLVANMKTQASFCLFLATIACFSLLQVAGRSIDRSKSSSSKLFRTSTGRQGKFPILYVPYWPVVTIGISRTFSQTPGDFSIPRIHLCSLIWSFQGMFGIVRQQNWSHFELSEMSKKFTLSIVPWPECCS